MSKNSFSRIEQWTEKQKPGCPILIKWQPGYLVVKPVAFRPHLTMGLALSFISILLTTEILLASL